MGSLRFARYFSPCICAPKLGVMFHLDRMFKSIIIVLSLVLASCTEINDLQVISYDESHMQIVESGFDNLKFHFERSSDKEKASLLFCLERYVDPYYQSQIDYEPKLYSWLQDVIEGIEEVTVKESALDVLLWDSSKDWYLCEISNSGKLVCSEEVR